MHLLTANESAIAHKVWLGTLPGHSVGRQQLKARIRLSCLRANIPEADGQACGLATPN